jgi:hypothetical protein
MKMKCEYCEIPKRELNTTDYFNQMILWRQNVNDGNSKFKGQCRLLKLTF